MSDGLCPLRVPSGFWVREDVGAVLQRRDVGGLFRLLRKYVGASQTQIGTAVGMEQGTVSRLMSGRRVVSAIDVLERIAEGLAMPDEARMRLGLAPKEDPMKRRAALGVGIMTALSPETLTGVLHDAAQEAVAFRQEVNVSSIGAGTLEHIAAVAAELYDSYPAQPAVQIFPVARAYRQRVAQLLGGKRTLEQARELYVLAADLSDLLSDLSFDLGSPHAAQEYALDSYEHADQAGHTELCAWAAGTLSTWHFLAGEPTKAVDVATLGMSRAPHRRPVEARLRAKAAEAYALQGSRDACVELLAEARALCDRLPDSAPSRLTTERPELLSRWAAFMGASCSILLREWPAAADQARAVMSGGGLPPGWLREAQLVLGVALANLGAPEEAAEFGGTALTTCGWPGTTLKKARDLDAVLQTRYPKEPATRDFHERYLQFAA
jgi:transcriptional regulator with XRE-family HTH domain